MKQLQREKYERAFLVLARAVTVGLAYFIASPIPGLTSSFVAIFMSLLPFDLMVAAPRPLWSRQEWRQSLTVMRPRLRATAVTLLKGVSVGAAFGILAVLGFPRTLGAVLTTGLAYVWATRTPHLVSSYVAIISGLSLYELLAQVPDFEVPAALAPLPETGAKGLAVLWVALTNIFFSAGGTFLGMALGWIVGALTGSVTRLFLSRPYRSLQSQAYDPPVTKKPFDQVLPISDRDALFTGRVEERAPLARRALAECRLRERYQATVLSVRRGEHEVVMPTGAFVILPGDELLMLARREHLDEVRAQLEAAPEGEPAAGGG